MHFHLTAAIQLISLELLCVNYDTLSSALDVLTKHV